MKLKAGEATPWAQSLEPKGKQSRWTSVVEKMHLRVWAYGSKEGTPEVFPHVSPLEAEVRLAGT